MSLSGGNHNHRQIEAGAGESIFEHGSKMGLLGEEIKDYWIYDSTAATWTRMIVEPRRDYYHPSEGDESCKDGPQLDELRDTRVTIPKSGPSVRDNWKKADSSKELSEDMPEDGWTGKTVFYENWADAVEAQEIARVTVLPGELVINDIPEYSWVDDLTGKLLDATLVTKAKLEEITEMYRRRVWLEKTNRRVSQGDWKAADPCSMGGHEQRG